MGLRTFTAETTEAAMDLVRRELGEDAVIHDIKRLPAGKGQPDGTRIQVRAQLPGVIGSPPLAGKNVSIRPVDQPAPVEPIAQEVTSQLQELAENLRTTHARLELLSAGMGWMGALPPDLPEGLSRLITDGLIGQIPTAGGIRIGATPHIVALVGPSGVGKTTVAGKLGWHFAQEEHRRVGMITTDTLHIGALERSRLICKRLGIPLAIIYAPEDVAGALERLADAELVLVDMPGGSPRDARYLGEIGDLLAALDPAEVHLVLSAGTGSAMIREALRCYAPLQPDQMLLTKIDEAPGLLDVLPFIPESGLALSYLSADADIAGGLQVASGAVLMRAIAGESLQSDEALTALES
ncbi:MAG: flagellar biosynthesis protein FlhF [Armatimonadota bacterium]